MTKRHHSVSNWVKAGKPLGEPFLITRESSFVDEDRASVEVEILTRLIVHALESYCRQAGGTSYRIEQLALPFTCDSFAYDYDGETFTVTVEVSPLVTGMAPTVRVSMSVYATILS